MITTIRCKPTTCAYMGSQYTSAEFNIKCQNYGLKHSYSLKGQPYENGRMEAFYSILKREEVYLKVYQTLTEVQAAIGWRVHIKIIFFYISIVGRLHFHSHFFIRLHSAHPNLRWFDATFFSQGHH